MTRTEFLESVSCIWELIDFCKDAGYDHLVEDIIDEEYYNDWVIENAREYTDWTELYKFLNDLPCEGYDYYDLGQNSYGDVRGLSDDCDFTWLRDEVLDAIDNDGNWDEEEEFDDDDEYNFHTEELKKIESQDEEPNVSEEELFFVLNIA